MWVQLVALIARSGLVAQSPDGALPKVQPSEGVEAARTTDALTEGASALAKIKIAPSNLEWLNRANDNGMVKRKVADYERLATYVKQLDPDLIAVQGVDGEAGLCLVFDDAEYNYHVASQNGVQLIGFAYRATLSVTKTPDVDTLDVGNARGGIDLTESIDDDHLRLLSVHLKSGSFDYPRDSTTPNLTRGAIRSRRSCGDQRAG